MVEGSATPQVMINASNDHQLFFKAYNDYSDLDDNSIPETTYDTTIDYYGYFDSAKCYAYNAADFRFEPRGMADSFHHCTGSMDDSWSGNFLNWASMARIDVIRKILFGGHRRSDTPTETVLERAYLPHDAHSWAKYYDGPDIQELTPFTRGVDYDCDQGDLSGCRDNNGNLVREMIGITLGNTTDVDMSLYQNSYSEEFDAPPLIKVVRGNHSLWASNERWQVTWSGGAPIDNHPADNSNDPAFSGIHAHASSPHWSRGIGAKNYVARVQVCVPGLIGNEKCKPYPGADETFGTNDDILKPVGLFQHYGDDNLMEFGMVAGSYNKHTSGGVLVRNMGSFNDEVNVRTDGTFPLVSQFAGGPMPTNRSEGLINAWSLFRIVGYDGENGYYNSGDNCSWGLSDLQTVTADNRCKNWGNPFAEIYYQSINYLSGNGVIGPYQSNLSTGIPGLPVPQPFSDPLGHDNYCAPLSVINLNSSVISYDFDQLDHQSYGPATIWDPNDLPGNRSTAAMTDVVGAAESIHDNDYYVGQVNLASGAGDQLCTPKTVTSLGGTGGICPEAPRLGGSYRIAGLAYYAHVKDIRPDTATGNRGLKGMQKLDTYSVAMASSLPVLDIVHPLTGEPAVKILPACRNTSLTPHGNCAVVDFKLVEQVVNDGGIGRGKAYINWEDSEQGGDYDQDMWGTLLYEINGNAGTISVTTQVHAQSTPYAMGFGYIISGTDDDGFHVHSGINGFSFPERADSGDDCSGPGGCNCRGDFGSCTIDGSSVRMYSLGASRAGLLEDPLWYAAKWGGFIDRNGNDMPDLQDEWDRRINATGEPGQDGIPDTYFYASHPRELENALNRVLTAILDRTSSGTAAAVVSSNVRGEGALYQAYYEPLKKDGDREASWVGTVQALWLDSSGFARQDCSPPRGYDGIEDQCVPPAGPCVPNGRLDNYCIDQVAETFYDDLEGRTRVRIYESNNPHAFEPYSMQGVAETYAGGSLAIVPNAMEGNVAYNPATGEMTLTPYEIRGTVEGYDAVTGTVTMSIAAGDWQGPANRTFSNWRVLTSSGPGQGFSSDPVTLAANHAVTLVVNPAGDWIALGDTLTLQTQGMVGRSGDSFADWGVECLQGTAATGEIKNFGISLSNWDGATFIVENGSADFTSCTMVRISTFNLRGTPCSIHNDWTVANLTRNTGVHGASSSPVTLMNSLQEPSCTAGTPSLPLVVFPAADWIRPGDRIMIANYRFTDQELHSLGYLWNAREQLYLATVPDPQLSANRAWSATADLGRHITTWIDLDLDNEVDADEYLDFDNSMFPVVSHGFFDVDSQEEAATVVDYVRGLEIPGTRGRTIRYADTDTGGNVMRLGDIINSTPTVVGSPQEAFNLLYGDKTYTMFRQQYQDRRIMVYAGGNDGLLHAFNGGFLNVTDDGFGRKTIEYIDSRRDSNGGFLDVRHPLGSEIWAYAPKNILAHLKWLKDPNYGMSHVFYVDGTPRVFDANIFAADADHPHGWGTVLVVGMNMGGGEMEIDTMADDHLPGDRGGDNIVTRSAYIIMDITNPEIPPRLLGEIQVPDGSYTTVFPAVAAFRDPGAETTCNAGTTRCNDWYLVFGTGPDNLGTAESGQTAKMYLFDLTQLTTALSARPAGDEAVPAGCRVDPLTEAMNVITCDTGAAASFMGTPVIVDWDLDFFADTAYFGLVGEQSGTSGSLWRQAFDGDPRPAGWSGVHTLFQANQPVSTQPVPAIDKLHNRWVFFGTGRYQALGDKTSTEVQSLYGVKDDQSGTAVGRNELLNVSATEVYTDRTLANPPASVSGAALTSFDALEEEIDNHVAGWYLDLPPILGLPGSAPATRNITDQALLGGVLFSSVFQPSDDPCTGEGLSRLYGLYYKTGTAYPGPTVFGSSPEDSGGEVKLRSLPYLDLGRGVATAPSIHSGADAGTSGLTIFTQLSTGDIVREQVETVLPVRTGKLCWREQ
ncbi:MAG: PilC/PilY family type IV pilus protein [Desulfobulbaceae bacterium]